MKVPEMSSEASASKSKEPAPPKSLGRRLRRGGRESSSMSSPESCSPELLTLLLTTKVEKFLSEGFAGSDGVGGFRPRRGEKSMVSQKEGGRGYTVYPAVFLFTLFF